MWRERISFYTSLIKQLLNMFKVWCEQGSTADTDLNFLYVSFGRISIFFGYSNRKRALTYNARANNLNL
jgi:hypothetical protein